MALDDPVGLLLIFFTLIFLIVLTFPESKVGRAVLAGSVVALSLGLASFLILHFLFGLIVMFVGIAMLLSNSRIIKKGSRQFGARRYP